MANFRTHDASFLLENKASSQYNNAHSSMHFGLPALRPCFLLQEALSSNEKTSWMMISKDLSPTLPGATKRTADSAFGYHTDEALSNRQG